MNIEELFNDIKNDKKIDSEFIKYILWYSPSKQSYLKPKLNIMSPKSFRINKEFLEYCIKKIFNLTDIVITKDGNNDWIRRKNIEHDILYINKNPDRVNLINDLVEGIRNAVAHGAVKVDGNHLICIAQDKPKLESIIKFFIKAEYKLIYKELKTLVCNYNKIDDEFDCKLFCLFNTYDERKISNIKVKYNKVSYTIKIHPNSNQLKKDEAINLKNRDYLTKTLYLVNKTTGYDYDKFRNNNTNLEIMSIDDFKDKVVSNIIIIK